MKTLLIGMGGFGKNLINDIKSDLNDHIDQALIAKNYTLRDSDVISDNDVVSKIDLDDMYIDKVKKLIEDYDQVIIANGLGLGSCKSLVHIIDIIISSKKNVEVIVTKPFKWEGKTRAELSESIIQELTDKGISMKIFDNNEMMNYLDEDIDTHEAFKVYNDVICEYIVQKYPLQD